MGKKQTCIYCQREWDKNNSGINILGYFICPECEYSIVKTNCREQAYKFYVKGLKKIWRCLEI
ncbi:sigma factor G inhibitor Gin [Desulfofalx alkaliphila]|uniref:sigma factor G inhibitor Gin n=1 Tax=Desulfofalx alkaliphila TaxID=105483 RepID=UPI000550FFB8